MTASLVISCIALAAWIYLLLARGGFWHVRCLEDVSFPALASWPDIAVIIPARNEADTLPHTLPTLLDSDYPTGLRIVLVDDRSEDGTASVATHLAADPNRSLKCAPGFLTVIDGGDLPPGWKGKVRAMQTGLEHIASTAKPPRYILFTDADIAYEPQAISSLVAQAEAGGLALTSLMVRLRCHSLAERFLIPAFVFFFQMLFPFPWVNHPSRKTAAAAGGCMLVRYDALLKMGGLQSIRSALIDDCALGRLIKKQGPIRLGLTRQVHSIRAYPKLQDIRAMVSRTAYDQLGYSVPALLAATLGMTVIYLGPVLFTVFGTGLAQLCGALCWLFMGGAFYPTLQFYGRSPWQCLALPVIALFYMGFTLDSAWQYWHDRGGQWKGRMQTSRAQAA